MLTHRVSSTDLLNCMRNTDFEFAGEKHIVSPGNWVACAGQDNTDALCTIGTVSNVLVGSLNDHGERISDPISRITF